MSATAMSESELRPTERLEQLVLASVALTTEPSLDQILNRVVNIATDVKR